MPEILLTGATGFVGSAGVQRLLGWTPPISLDQGLKRTGAMDPRDKPEDDDGG